MCGMPAGVIVWWNIPNATQVAGRVGAVGGGDSIGLAIPWISINFEDGNYLRKLIDESTPEKPVKVKMNIQCKMEEGKDRMLGNVYGILEGKQDKYIILPTHVDSYFYGIFDNGYACGLNLALANYYSKIPKEEREYGLIFLFQGDHEVPRLDGTLPFVKKYEKEWKEKMLMVLRPEHLGMSSILSDVPVTAPANTEQPLMLLMSNRSPYLLDLFVEASEQYAVPMANRYIIDAPADEMAFLKPYSDLGPNPIVTGWISTGIYYHTTLDGEMESLMHAQSIEKIARAHAYIIDSVFTKTEAELREGEIPRTDQNIYASEMMKMYFGNY